MAPHTHSTAKWCSVMQKFFCGFWIRVGCVLIRAHPQRIFPKSTKKPTAAATTAPHTHTAQQKQQQSNSALTATQRNGNTDDGNDVATHLRQHQQHKNTIKHSFFQKNIRFAKKKTKKVRTRRRRRKIRCLCITDNGQTIVTNIRS